MNVVVAVSGGVDSMALLDMLVHKRLQEVILNYPLQTTNYKLIVAHFDHGIRKESASDEKFVRGVVGEYGLAYESARAELGTGASEEQARKMRYNFLRQVCKKYNAPLVTAHHQDDLVETMVINLIRGTGWRGLVSLGSTDRIIRPLLHIPKTELINYAKKQGLRWREDSTNRDESYLRNYVRLKLLPTMQQKDRKVVDKLLAINIQTEVLKNEIATELQKIIPHFSSSLTYPRHPIIMWPSPVAFEFIYQVLTQLDPDWHPNRLQIVRTLHFIKIGQPQKTLEVSGRLQVTLTTREVQFKRA